MKYEIKEAPGASKKIEVEISPEEFDAYYAEALRDFAKEAELPGFRKGKAPEKMIEGKVGQADLLSEAAERAIRDNWFKIVKESGLEAVSQPHVEIVKVAKGNPFIFTAEVEVLPEIKLPDIREIGKGIKAKEIKVDEKEIEDAFSWLRQSRAKTSAKDGPAEKGDFVKITFYSPDIKDDKEKQDGFVIGKGHYVKGLEDNLLGMKAGEEKEFETENPLNKKEKIKIKAKVASIEKVELPEATDEWAKTLGGFADLKSLKEDIAKGIKEEKETSQKQEKREEALRKILEATKFDAPKSMVEREFAELMDNLKKRVEAELKTTFEDYLSQVKKTAKEVEDDFRKVAEDRVKGFLILHQIAKDEKIEIKEDEIEKKINELLAQYPDKEAVKKNMDMEQMKMYVEDELKRERIFNILNC